MSIKFCAKHLDENQQSFSRSEEAWRGNVLWTCFRRLTVLERKIKQIWSCLELSKLRPSIIVQPLAKKTVICSQRYKLIDSRGLPDLHLSSLRIPHGLWTPHGENLDTKSCCSNMDVIKHINSHVWIES